MDPQVSTSFIPKKPLVPARARGSASGLVLLLAILIFIGSVVAGGGVFAYDRYLKSTIASKQHSLELAQAAYEPGVIESLIRLDSRLGESKRLLGKHLAPSAIFMFLSTQTLERVQLTSFDYVVDESGAATLELVGVADTFSALALQSDQFGTSNVLRNVIFSNILISPTTGKVSFAVHADVDPSLLLYTKNLNRESVLVPSDINVVNTDTASTTPAATTSTPQ